MAKTASVYLHEFRRFWGSIPPFSAAVQLELPLLAIAFSSFLHPSLAKSNEVKGVKMYAGPKGASNSRRLVLIDSLDVSGLGLVSSNFA